MQMHGKLLEKNARGLMLRPGFVSRATRSGTYPEGTSAAEKGLQPFRIEILEFAVHNVHTPRYPHKPNFGTRLGDDHVERTKPRSSNLCENPDLFVCIPTSEEFCRSGAGPSYPGGLRFGMGRAGQGGLKAVSPCVVCRDIRQFCQIAKL